MLRRKILGVTTGLQTAPVYAYLGRMAAGKVILLVLDGVGIGELPDAAHYGDEGSNTLGHTVEAAGGIQLASLRKLGLGNIEGALGVEPIADPQAAYGRMAEASEGKDSTTGHWELAGLINRPAFPTYPNGFPGKLVEDFVRATGCGGVLGNQNISGTAIIDALGAKHMETGYPILYTSADSVFQIAAHEEVMSLKRLYEICAVARAKVCVGEHEVSRVIARPFVGTPGKFKRTANRRDFSVAPRGPTLLDVLAEAAIPTRTIGKVDELFAKRGVGAGIHTRDNAHGIVELIRAASSAERELVFANLVDFDTVYGHRND